MQKYCKNCGKELEDNALFCSQCGEKIEIEALKNCPQCQKELNGEEKFCPYCGTEIYKEKNNSPNAGKVISPQIWENVKEGQKQYFDALSKDKVHLLEMVNMICFIITAVSILFLPLLTYSAYTYSGAPVETVGLLRMLSNGMGGLYGLLVAGLFFIAAFVLCIVGIIKNRKKMFEATIPIGLIVSLCAGEFAGFLVLSISETRGLFGSTTSLTESQGVGFGFILALILAIVSLVLVNYYKKLTSVEKINNTEKADHMEQK